MRRTRSIFPILIIFSVVLFSILFSGPAKASGDWALNFDGADDFVLLPSINVGTVFSIEAWFNLDEPDFYRTLFKDYWEGSNFGTVFVNNMELSWWWQGSYPKLFTRDLNLDTWYHFVITADGSTVSLYLNGVFKQNGNYSPNYNNDLKIGTSDDGTYWDGMVDEVRLYNRVLSAQEIQEHYQKVFNNNSGLAGLWHFNEGSGSTATDSSGNGRNGIVFGATYVQGVGVVEAGEPPATPSTPTPSAPPQVGVLNTIPKVTINTKLAGTYRDKLVFNYSVFDPDSGQGALRANPMYFFYSDDGGIRWKEIAKDKANTGTYEFDTAKVPDGMNYKIRVVAFDGHNDFGEAISDTFSIDNTGPTFDISILPPSPVKEKENISVKIIASENLKTAPQATITQEGGSTVALALSGSGKEFTSSYTVLKDYRGKAMIFVSGEDLVGNTGAVITSGKSFFVERFGPPPPVIQEPLNNQIFTSPIINIRGTSEPNATVALLLNGVSRFKVKSSNDGKFNIENISLTSANNGYNTLSFSAINVKGEEGEETVLKVKLNSPPKVAITSISLNEVMKGEKEIIWNASDANDDKLMFSFEYSNDGGSAWDFIVAGLRENSYKLDTTQLADGADYLLRITADDGTEKTTAPSKKFAIKNGLPHIALDIPLNYLTNSNTPVITGKTTGSESNIAQVEYSLDNGETWRLARALDGKFDGPVETFEINILLPLKDGKQGILIKTKDSLSRSVKIARSFIVDTIPPVVPFIESPDLKESFDDNADVDGELEGVQVNLRGRAEPETKIEFVLGGEKYRTFADSKGSFAISNITLKSHGENIFSLSSFDSAGNVSQTSGAAILNNLPRLVILNPSKGGFAGGQSEIKWEIGDKDNDPVSSSIFYQKKGGSWISLARDLASWETKINSYKWDSSAAVGGEYRLKILISDGMGETEEIVDVIVDNVSPSVELEGADSFATNDTKPTFEGRARDDVSGVEYVEYSFDNGDWYKALITAGFQTRRANFRFRHPFLLSDGRHQLNVRAIDRAGNIAYSKPLTITIDTTPPRIGSYVISMGDIILFPEKGVFAAPGGTNLKFTISLENDAKLAFLDIDWQKINLTKKIGLWETEFQFPLASGNEVPIFISAEDIFGNTISKKEIGKIAVLNKGRAYYLKEQGAIEEPLERVEINVSIFNADDQSWTRWQAESYNLANPIFTASSGEYDLFLPEGIYQFSLRKTGFDGLKISGVKISAPRFVTVDFELFPRGGIGGLLERLLEKINIF